MQTFGFTCGMSGLVTLDEYFNETLDLDASVASTYITLPSSGTEGSLVYENTAGEVMYCPYMFFGHNPIGAVRVLTSATVNGTPRTTTATPLGFHASINK